MVLVKNLKFFPFFYSRENRQENTFHDILERKNAFLEYKNKRLNGCGPKFKIFHLFISGKIGQENAFHQHFRGHCWLEARL